MLMSVPAILKAQTLYLLRKLLQPCSHQETDLEQPKQFTERGLVRELVYPYKKGLRIAKQINIYKMNAHSYSTSTEDGLFIAILLLFVCFY